MWSLRQRRGTNTVAAQFTFGGSTYVAINLLANGFQDGNDLLIDITGVTGTIADEQFHLSCNTRK